MNTVKVPHRSVVIHVNEYNELMHEKALLEKQLQELSELKSIDNDKLETIINDSDKNIIVLTKKREIRTAMYEYTHQFYDREFLNTFIEVKSLSESFAEEISDYMCNEILFNLLVDKNLISRVKEKIKKTSCEDTYEFIKDEVDSEIDKVCFNIKDGRKKNYYDLSKELFPLIRRIFKRHNNE